MELGHALVLVFLVNRGLLFEQSFTVHTRLIWARTMALSCGYPLARVTAPLPLASEECGSHTRKSRRPLFSFYLTLVPDGPCLQGAWTFVLWLARLGDILSVWSTVLLLVCTYE